MRRSIRSSLLITVTLTIGSMLSVQPVSAAPKAGGAERTVFDDRRICKDGGHVVLGYKDPDPPPAPLQRPDRMRIESLDSPKWTIEFPITLKADPVKFDDFVDPLGADGRRPLSVSRRPRWPFELDRGSKLRVTVLGDPESAEDIFPNPNPPPTHAAITVRNCELFD